jgi:hypothetical protein
MHTVRDSGHVSQAPAWADAEKMADNLLSGSLRPAQVDAMHKLVIDIRDKAQRELVLSALASAKPATLAEAVSAVHRASSGEEPAVMCAPAEAVDDVFPPSDPLFDAGASELPFDTVRGLTLDEQCDDHKSRYIKQKAAQPPRPGAEAAWRTAAGLHRPVDGGTRAPLRTDRPADRVAAEREARAPRRLRDEGGVRFSRATAGRERNVAASFHRRRLDNRD